MSEFGIAAKPQSYSDPDAYCDHVIASGVKWIRLAPEWGSIETAKGVYNATYLAKLDNIVNRLTGEGVNILWILCYTAPWASSQPGLPWPDVTRHKPASWSDWGDYVTFIVSRYDGKISHWEVWNEPDHLGFWKSSVADYHALLETAHARIKAVNPFNVVLLGGLAMTTGTTTSYGLGTFFDQLMDMGAGAHFDLVNYHAYGNYARHLALYRGMMDVINKHAIQAKPIWITETGYSTEGDPSREPMKADMVDQIHLGNLRWENVERYFWHCYSNPVMSPPNPLEENFGLTTATLTPLKAFHHYQALGAAETDFALQAAYPALTPTVRALYYFPASGGDGSHVTALGDDRLIPATRYMYFRVADAWLHDGNGGIDTALEVDVTFLDAGTGNFALQYDSAASAYQSVSVARTNTGQWRKVTLALNDVKFANRQNNAADFRLYAGGSTSLTVRKVAVRKRFNPASVVLKATPVFKLIDYVVAGSGEAHNPVATMGGVECRSITANNRYFYFRVSDALARAGDTSIDVAITFWDLGTDKLALHYAAVGNAYKAINITKTNTQAWRTVTLSLSDAHFVNAQNYSADFRISNGWDGTPEYVRRVDVTVNGTGFAAWTRSQGLRGELAAPDADPDGDGLANLLEYALGGAPLIADSTVRGPRLGLWSQAVEAPERYLSLLARRDPAAREVRLFAEVSDDLQSWFSGHAHTTVIADAPDVFHARDNTPLTEASRRFMRLSATR